MATAYRSPLRPRLRSASIPKSIMSVAMPGAPTSQGVSPGFVSAPPSRPKATVKTKPKKPAVPKDPGVLAIEQTRDRHVRQANDAASWLASVLGAVQNSSNQSTANFNAQLGIGQRNLQAIGGFTGPNIASISPGGFIGGIAPTTETAEGLAGALGVGGLRAELARQGLTDVTQSLISGAKRYATSLPSVYADKVASYLEDLRAFQLKMEQFGIEQETKRYQIDSQNARSDADRAARVEIANMNEAGRNARFAAGASAGGGFGSYKGMGADDYSKLARKWSVDAYKMMNTPVSIAQPDGKTLSRNRTPREVFDLMVGQNLRPMDALRILSSSGATIGPDTMYAWLAPILGATRARAATKQITGVDYVPATGIRYKPTPDKIKRQRRAVDLWRKRMGLPPQKPLPGVYQG